MRNLKVLCAGGLFILLFLIGASPLRVLAQTPRINFGSRGLYPEGLAFSANTNLFYVSSVTTGTIGSVDANGVYKAFYQDSGLCSTFGMKVDPAGKILWVCAGDPNYSRYSSPETKKKMARLLRIDLTSGRKLSDIDLSATFKGPHFTNDLALDDSGNAFVTDSFSPVIYKVDKAGKATLLATSELFKSVDIGLNGIAWNSDGYLLVNNDSDGEIFKVDLKQPSRVSKVRIAGFYPGADGMFWDGSKNLVLIQNKGSDRVVKLSSTDSWVSAKETASTSAEDRFQQPSSGVRKRMIIYVLNSKINELADPTKKPSDIFSIQEVVFKPH